MAFLYVTEYSTLGLAFEGQFPSEPPLADYRIANAGASTAGPAFQPGTRYVRLHADSICSVVIGAVASATATTSNQRFAAGQTEYKGIPQQSPQTYGVIAVLNT